MKYPQIEQPSETYPYLYHCENCHAYTCYTENVHHCCYCQSNKIKLIGEFIKLQG